MSMPAGDDIGVYVKCPLERCQERDVKWLCQKARAGLIADFTGAGLPREAALHPRAVIAVPAPELESDWGRLPGYRECSLTAAGGE